MKPWLTAAAVPALLFAATLSIASMPMPPCGGFPVPAYPPLGAPPQFELLHGGTPEPVWRPPACAAWMSSTPVLLLGFAARFRSNANTDEMLERFGAISTLVQLRYWSVTDGAWEALFKGATALDAADPDRPRLDFTLDELKSGRALYFAEQDNRSSRPVIYRMAVRDVTERGFTVDFQNLTPVTFLLAQLYPSGALQSTIYLQRQSAGTWNYYALMEIAGQGWLHFPSADKSFVNRAAAFFRHIAEIPSDQEPPAAP